MKDIKHLLDELVIFGGQPTFSEVRHVGRPNIGNRKKFHERMDDILDRKWLTNQGRYVQEFEKRIQTFLDVKHCIMTCNGTIAMQIVSRALGLEGEVIMPSFTFIATPHALEWQGINPVFCDIHDKTWNLDPEKIESLITPKTTGVVGVHLWGRACDLERLEAVAKKHRLKLVYDAAHAFGCSSQGRMIGNFGEAEVFSFHATKFLNSFEGGAVVTNNDALAEKVRHMINFGFAGHDKGIYIGTNGKMNEVSAAMGVTNLENFQEVLTVNQRNYRLYRESLEGLAGLRMIDYNSTEKNNYQYVVLAVDQKKTQINADQIASVLHGENVLAKRYFSPACHQQEPYLSRLNPDKTKLSVTESLGQQTLLLPTGTAISPEDIEKIAALLKMIITNGKEISGRLAKE